MPKLCQGFPRIVAHCHAEEGRIFDNLIGRSWATKQNPMLQEHWRAWLGIECGG